MKKTNKKSSAGKTLAIAAGVLGGAALAARAVRKQRELEEEEPLIALVEEGVSLFSVVHPSGLLTTPGADTKRVDLEVQLATDIAAATQNDTGAALPVLSADAEGTFEQEAFEILVGNTGRTESDIFRHFLAPNEYGFAVLGNKIVVAGTNLTTTQRAVALFIEFLGGRAVSDANGRKTLWLAQDEQQYAAADEWLVDIPAFTAGSFAGTHDADLGSLLFRYEETAPEDFEQYCALLEQSGYTLFQRNDIEGNLHAIYTGEPGQVCVSYIPFENAVRITTTKAGEYELPHHLEPPVFEKLCESSLTQLACDYTRHEYGMGYIVALENGSFVLFDGGDNRNTGTFIDLLYKKLTELNKRPDGKIVIEGWFLSHTHVDHYGTFANFCYKYGKEVTVEQVFFSTTSAAFEYNAVSPDRYIQNNMAQLRESIPGAKFVKVHAGMRFYLGNAAFEILHTPQDLYPLTPFYFNDTSIVWRMFMNGESSMWLGDIADRGSDVMCARYGDYLRSDVVQVSHHGYVGGTVELYERIAGRIALWPVNQVWYDRMIAPDFRYYKENITAANLAEAVYVAEQDITLTVPYTPPVKQKKRRAAKKASDTAEKPKTRRKKAEA